MSKMKPKIKAIPTGTDWTIEGRVDHGLLLELEMKTRRLTIQLTLKQSRDLMNQIKAGR